MWDRLAKENGLSGLTFAIQGAEWNPSEGGTSQSGDYRIMYEPGYTGTQKRISKGGADVHNLDISAHKFHGVSNCYFFDSLWRKVWCMVFRK